MEDLVCSSPGYFLWCIQSFLSHPLHLLLVQLEGFEQQLTVRLLCRISALISWWRSEQLAHWLLVTLELASSILGLNWQHQLPLEDLLLCCCDYLLWLERWWSRSTWTLEPMLQTFPDPLGHWLGSPTRWADAWTHRHSFCSASCSPIFTTQRSSFAFALNRRSWTLPASLRRRLSVQLGTSFLYIHFWLLLWLLITVWLAIMHLLMFLLIQLVQSLRSPAQLLTLWRPQSWPWASLGSASHWPLALQSEPLVCWFRTSCTSATS